MVVGRIGRPHGLAGEVAVWSESDDPERFRPGSELRAGDEELVVASSRIEEGRLFIRFEGVSDRPGVELLRGTLLTVEAEARRELDEDEFWPDELVGMAVRTVAGTPVGVVVDVVEGPAQDRLVIEAASGRVEIPFVRALVPEVSRDGRQIVVDPPHGLLESVSP
ncbi:MAG: ribosome maturation factor RimM [Acidimicrobiia bacterium]